MIFKDISFDSLLDNVYFDEVLFRLVEKGDIQKDVLRFWESKEYGIVLGRGSKVEEDVFSHIKKSKKIKVLRRCSGGGTVLQGPGCLNYCIIMNKLNNNNLSNLNSSYKFISEKIIFALKKLNVNAIFYPISDIALCESNKKISGNAQRRGRKCFLHHGTLLYDFDLSLIGKYLKMPKDVPNYRQQRDHKDFVSNIIPKVTAKELKNSIAGVFDIDEVVSDISAEEDSELSKVCIK